MSDSFESAEPSHGEANKMLRVLSGERLKYTVRVHLPDDRVLEWQSQDYPRIKFNDEARALWLHAGDYESRPVMAWPDGSVLLVEENPKV